MAGFLQAEAAYLAAPEDIEPIIDDVTNSLGDPYLCEGEGCDANAIAELSWPMEDHDLPTGFFCELCLEAALANNPTL